MINSIRLKNFKSHADTKIDFGRLTALVGPNSSGKTSVLQAIHYMSQIVLNEEDTLIRNPGEWLRKGKSSSTLTLHVYEEGTDRWKEGTDIWEVKLDDKGPSARMQTGEDAFDQNLNFHRYPFPWHPSLNIDLKAVYLKIVTENLASPTYTDQIPPKIKQNGDGLASAVAYLMTYEPDKFQELQNTAKRVIPSLTRIRVRPARIRLQEKRLFTMDDTRIPFNEVREVTGHQLVFDMVGGEAIPSELVSDGTLHALGLLTMLFSPEPPHILLLDDVEQGLHSKAQRELIRVFRDMLKSHKDLQIVLTTHSPYIVDELEASQVWVLCQNEFGQIASCRLSDHPDATRALNLLTTGEFLSAEGEKWVLGREKND